MVSINNVQITCPVQIYKPFLQKPSNIVFDQEEKISRFQLLNNYFIKLTIAGTAGIL